MLKPEVTWWQCQNVVGIKHLAKSKKFRISLLVVVLLAAGFGGWRYVANQRAAEAERQRIRFETLVKNTNDLTWKKQYDQAASRVQDYIQSAPNKEFEMRANVQLGTVYLNANQPAAALPAFKRAEALGGSEILAVVSGIALAAELTGDNATAAEAYNRVADLLEPSANEGYNTQTIETYRAKAKALQP